MVLRNALLRRRLEQHADDRLRTDHDGGHRRPGSAFSNTIRRLLTGEAIRNDPDRGGELAELPLPDLLSLSPSSDPIPERLLTLLDLAFLGRASAGELDRVLGAMPAGESRWQPTHFADDLFLAELLEHIFTLRIGGIEYPAHRRFLERVLANPPPAGDHVRFRQAILAELESSPALVDSTEGLTREIIRLLTLLRASRDDARLEPVRFRFDVLRAFRRVVDRMTGGFTEATSGLNRIHETGESIRRSRAYERLEALLDHDESMAHLSLEAVVGADGRLRHLEIKKLSERRKNPFFRRPLRRWWDRLRIAYHRYRLGADELADRLVMGVYHDAAPAMARVVQMLCHLEVYLTARSMAVEARSRGLEVCLPQLHDDNRLEIEELFNPLLLVMTDRPVPSDLRMDAASPITLVTGPNSGGKTRLLQAIGIAQVLAQGGLYAPCRSGRMPLTAGLFASIVEVDRADQAEGRLGTEMVRLRTLFENVPPGSLVLLDELCSGTNPSEAIEIVEMVLRMLRQIDPVAFVTTHFLDFAHAIQSDPPVADLRFLQAEVDPRRGATFRFRPGVATTSLAVGTARRLGVTFDELERKIARRNNEREDEAS
jgi:DNA mismatch repair protein MutS2